MTLLTCQGASKEEAGIVEGQTNGYGNYGTTSTQQQYDRFGKKRDRDQGLQSVGLNDEDELLEWDDLCKGICSATRHKPFWVVN
jgi:adiponectin receptor